MNNKEHESMEHNHEGHSHDIHTVLTPTHDAFSDLLKENVKSKLLNDKKVMESIDKLGSMGYDLISNHLDSMMEEITNSYNEMKNHH